ncbi:MFS transporter [Bacillus sp. 31A1R]|uniref:MFS transporter n=1 Tax=Robertmurraya mangrovi TaxID=3098077 RepID=A0ABU5J003_9BACI|nr:MFS transporter [Bacillus sp. 31A1R]MDZ5472722.1 MFS transporter [Bacillus sp. 31A1R]
MLSFYYLLVTLPLFALQELQAKASEAGLLVTIFLIAAILIRPFASQGMRILGKRMILLISVIIFFLSSALYFLPESIFTLLILRFVHGIGFGMATTVCGTIVADLVPDSRRGEGMGYFIMSSNLAMVIGPFLGLTIMNQSGETLMFTFSAVFSLCSLVISLLIKLPKATDKIKAPKEQAIFRLSDIFEKSAIKISVIAALFAIVYSSILSFVSVYAIDLGLMAVSNFFFVVYAFVLLLTRPFTGRWYDRFGPNVIIYPCIILFAVGMFLLSQTTTATIFLISAAIIGIGWGTLFPSFQTIAIQETSPERRGLATATFLSIFDLGIGIGSFVIGLAAAKVDFHSLYLYGSLYILLGLVAYYLLHARTKKTLSYQNT